MRSRPHRPSIHILDDDSLLNVFFLYRPVLLDEGYRDDYLFFVREREWVRERWWFKFTHVCRRWRYLVLGSASYLRLCLVCTYGTPVADMLAHSPLLPLIIMFVDETRETTAEDEGGILLALQNRDRVRCIHLQMHIQNLQRVLLAIDDEFSMLEHMHIEPLTKEDGGPEMILPQTFQAPHLRHLILSNFAILMRSPLLTTAAGLVTLSLERIYPSSAYFHPNDLLQRLSLMPQIQVLGIILCFLVPIRETEMQLWDAQTTTHITLPNLRCFGFRGVSAYLEALLPRMTTPLLQRLQIIFFNQLTYTVPHLLQFISTKENLKFRSAEFLFSPQTFSMLLYPHHGSEAYNFGMEVVSTPFDLQVAYAAQFFDALGTAFSAVKHITLQPESQLTPIGDRQSTADRTQWRKLFRSFGNVKTLCVPDNGLITQVSHSLRPDNEESPMELLPELNKLEYSAGVDAGDGFTPFVDAREKAGHPITIAHL